MQSSVQYDIRGDTWVFAGNGRSSDGAYSIIIKDDDLDGSSATDLARALRKARKREMEPESIAIDMAGPDEYDPRNAIVESIHYVLLADGRLGVTFPLASDEKDDADALYASTRRLLDPLLERTGAQLVSIQLDTMRASAPYFHDGTLTAATRGKSLRDFHDLASAALTLCDAASGEGLSAATVADLVLGGRADILIGQPEGPWLDVKSAHYDLNSPTGKISLAQAVSRFCNAEEGGVIVIGMDTKRNAGGEVIRSVKPTPMEPGIARRYRQAVESRIFPFPEGLSIRTVETSRGEGLVVLHLPPQPEELKPFLVHGAIAEGRIEGAFISIVRRSGEDSIPITAQQIHSTLAAGRALLRRGEVPPVRQVQPDHDH